MAVLLLPAGVRRLRSYLSALRISSYQSPYGMLGVPLPSVQSVDRSLTHSTASVIFSARILALLKYSCQRFVTRFSRRNTRKLTLENHFT